MIVRIVVVAMLGGVAPFPSQTVRAQTPDASLIEEAFTYAIPISEIMRLRWLYVEGSNNPSRGVNTIAHGRDLVDHRRRAVTMPNNDTLYSRSFLDLSGGPVQIHAPDINDRYYSVAFYDIFTNNFASIGRRLTGTREGDFLVVGPEWDKALPEGARTIRSPSNDVLVLTRIAVDGEADLPAARAAQDGVRVSPLVNQSSARPKGFAPKAGDVATFLSTVNQALAANAVPTFERPLLERFARVGICGEKCSWGNLPAEVQATWIQHFPTLPASLKKPIAGDSKPVND